MKQRLISSISGVALCRLLQYEGVLCVAVCFCILLCFFLLIEVPVVRLLSLAVYANYSGDNCNVSGVVQR